MSIKTQEDISQLIAQIALKDRASFDRLYALTCAKLFGVLLRILKDKHEAEDVLQDVYVRIWQRAEQFAVRDTQPMSWLIAIARNAAIDKIRSRKAPSMDVDDLKDVISDHGPTPETEAMASSDRVQIDYCLDQLDRVKSEAVRAAYLEGYSYQELATRFDTPLNTMRTWLRRSLRQLKTCLEGRIDVK